MDTQRCFGCQQYKPRALFSDKQCGRWPKCLACAERINGMVKKAHNKPGAGKTRKVYGARPDSETYLKIVGGKT